MLALLRISEGGNGHLQPRSRPAKAANIGTYLTTNKVKGYHNATILWACKLQDKGQMEGNKRRRELMGSGMPAWIGECYSFM